MAQLLRILSTMSLLIACSTAPKSPSPVTENETVVVPEETDDLLIQLAAKDKTLEVVDLINKGRHPDTANRSGVTSLMIAAYRGNVDLIRGLAKAGASIEIQDKQGSAALHYAVIRDQINSVNALLKLDAKLDQTDQFGLSPLMLAVRFASPGVIEALIDAGAPIDQIETDNGWSALFFSIPRNRRDIFELLVGRKANFRLTDKDGRNLLMLATEYSQLTFLDRLLELGLDPNQTDIKGDNCLHKAVQSGSTDILRFFIQRSKMNINQPGQGGDTALVQALKLKNKALVDELLLAGANPDLPHQNGKTPRQLAEELNLSLDQSPNNP